MGLLTIWRLFLLLFVSKLIRAYLKERISLKEVDSGRNYGLCWSTRNRCWLRCRSSVRYPRRFVKYKMVLNAGPEWSRQADNQKGMNPFVDAVGERSYLSGIMVWRPYSLVRGTDGIRTLRPDHLVIGGTLGVDGEWDKGWPCGDNYTRLNDYDLML